MFDKQVYVQREVSRWAQKLLKGPFLLGDTETTGFTKSDQVIEMTVMSHEGEVLFNSRFHSEVPVSPGATEVNGIRTEDLADCPTFGERFADIAAVFQTYPDVPVLWYNAAFDIRMLRQTAAYAARLLGHEDNLIPEPPIGLMLMQQWGRPTLSVMGELEHRSECLMLKYSRFNGERKRSGDYLWHSLVNACRKEGIDVRGEHSSAGDCRLGLMLLKRLAQEHEDNDD